MKNIALAYQIAISTITTIIFPTAIGIWLDNKFNISPLFCLTGMIFGLILWTYYLLLIKRNTEK